MCAFNSHVCHGFGKAKSSHFWKACKFLSNILSFYFRGFRGRLQGPGRGETPVFLDNVSALNVVLEKLDFTRRP